MSLKPENTCKTVVLLVLVLGLKGFVQVWMNCSFEKLSRHIFKEKLQVVETYHALQCVFVSESVCVVSEATVNFLQITEGENIDSPQTCL